MTYRWYTIYMTYAGRIICVQKDTNRNPFQSQNLDSDPPLSFRGHEENAKSFLWSSFIVVCICLHFVFMDTKIVYVNGYPGTGTIKNGFPRAWLKSNGIEIIATVCLNMHVRISDYTSRYGSRLTSGLPQCMMLTVNATQVPTWQNVLCDVSRYVTSCGAI